MNPEQEVVFERTLDASPEAVWEAWTRPEMIREWWGPYGVSIPACEIELRPGGRMYIVMEAGEAMGPFKGTRWPIEGTFTRVEHGSALSYRTKAWTEGREATTQIDQLTELVLRGENGRTHLDLHVTIERTGPGARMAVQGMQMGFSQQMEKLAAFLAKGRGTG